MRFEKREQLEQQALKQRPALAVRRQQQAHHERRV
jgi:hypothetical protein